MNPTKLKLNQHYAVKFPRRAWKRVPRICPVRKCLLVDKRNNGRLVVSYNAMVPQNLHLHPEHKRTQDILEQNIEFAPGIKLVVVTTAQVIDSWETYEARKLPPGWEEVSLGATA